MRIIWYADDGIETQNIASLSIIRNNLHLYLYIFASLHLKNIYFLSDFHLGVPDAASSLAREKKICKFLDEISSNAEEIFLVGDIFDMWYEYKSVVPKGYTRLLGKLAELTDRGIKISAFTGNHDMWMFGYFETELNIPVYRNTIEREWNGKKFLIGHGDGLGPGDHGYKFIKSVFANRFCQWLFGWLHPDLGLRLANYFSQKSRIATGKTDNIYHGDEKERLTVYCRERLKEKHYDYFIFGHRHLPLEIKISDHATYFNLGDWIQYYTYIEFDGITCALKKYDPVQS
jgi:UDP-2,3-diacylglucosamine hydrolase